MIFDYIINIGKYDIIPFQDEILNFLSQSNIEELQDGDIKLREDDLFVKVLRYVPTSESDSYFETHKEYADLQIMIRGVESFYVADKDDLVKTEEFNLPGDFNFYKPIKETSRLILKEDKFVFVLPNEPHKPGCIFLPSHTPILKLVFKIKIN